jgi:hypothetical protein
MESRERDGKPKHEEIERGFIPLFDFKRKKVLLYHHVSQLNKASGVQKLKQNV